MQLSNGYIALRNIFTNQITAGTFPNKANCKKNSFNKIIFALFFKFVTFTRFVGLLQAKTEN